MPTQYAVMWSKLSRYNRATASVRSESKPVGGCLTGISLPFRLVRQRDESGEASGLVLQLAQLPHVIHPVRHRLEMAEQHRTGAVAAQPMPGAVDIKIFLGGLLALGDPVAHFLLKNLRPAACQRIQPKRL